MLMPKELKKRTFAHTLRGYSTAEVDEYVDFLVEQYTNVYRENDELERKLTAALRALQESREREAGVLALEKKIRSSAEEMLRDAEKQKKKILADAEEFADQLVADADAHVAVQEALFHRMQTEILSFRDQLFAQYSTHIDAIEQIANTVEEASFSDALPDTDAPDTDAEEAFCPSADTDAEMYEEDTADIVPPEDDNGIETDFVCDSDESGEGNPALSAIFSEEEMESLLPPLSASALDTVPWESGDGTDGWAEDDGKSENGEDAEEDEAADDGDDALLAHLRQAFSVEYASTPVASSHTDPEAELEFLDEEVPETETPRRRGGLSRRFGKEKDGE